MKVLLFNGSPRSGNTEFAINTINSSIEANIPDAQTTVINVTDKDINCCIGCDSCIKNNGICVFDDDMFDILEEVREADVMIFGSPVYWWGITAQLKAVIDRMYALSGRHGKKEKKIGIVTIGQDSLDGPQYGLISKQFECICKHLEWKIIFNEAISAFAPEDIKKNSQETQSLTQLWKKI